jgi:O-antigen/teichoic acid export membrane protein
MKSVRDALSAFKNLERLFRCHLGQEGTLRRRAIDGGQWMILRSALQVLVDLVRTVVFSRVLFPDDYGLMALAMVAFFFLESLSAVGVDIQILRDGSVDPRRLDVYWTVRFFRGLLLAALMWVVADPMAGYYQRPELAGIIQCLSLFFFLKGLSGFGREIRQRDMQFRKVAIADSAASLVVLVAGLALLFWFENVWALVAYTILEALASAVTSYVLYPRRPRFCFDWGILKEVLVFSGSIISITMLNYFFTNYDKGVIGKLLGIEELGYYARAYFLATVPVVYFTDVLAPVVLSSLRSIGTDRVRFRAAFWKLCIGIGSLCLAIGLAFFLFSEEIIRIVYGERWLPILPVFQILLLYGISKGLISVLPTFFFLEGKPWIITLTSFVMTAIFGLSCIPMTQALGLAGMAWTIFFSAAISHALSFGIALHLLYAGGERKRAAVVEHILKASR